MMAEWELHGSDARTADALHRESIVVDMLLSTNFARATPFIDGKNALDRALSGGLTVATQTLAASDNRTFRAVIREINNTYRLLDAEPKKTRLILVAEDIERAKADGALGIIMSFQNTAPLEDDWINTLPIFHRLGVRMIQLTYNERNLVGSGCTEPVDGGLTAYGKQVVGALNDLGIIVDLSHVGRKTAMDAINVSRDPVIVSHANVYALTPHPRNLTDDMIRAVADTGGVIGIVTWAPLCATRRGESPTLSDVLDHLDHIVNLVGPDHVGIGSDINESYRILPTLSDFETRYRSMLSGAEERSPCADGFRWVHEVGNVTRGLVARGYAVDDIRKFLGGNFMRVARRVWT